MELQDQVVFITGGAGGLGRAMCHEFANQGARLIVGYRSNAVGAAALIGELGGDGHSAKEAPVEDSRRLTSLAGEIEAEYGRLDILINNAGIAINGKIASHSNAAWQALIDTNVSAVFYLSRAAIGHMRQQGGGVIINMSSECGLIGYEDLAAYSATKGAIVMFTKVLALDHASDKIRVNAICPGDIDTPMTDIGWQALNLTSEEIREKLKEHIPIGRVGRTEDIAAAAMFLASDAAGFVTGAILPVDGGTTTR